MSTHLTMSTHTHLDPSASVYEDDAGTLYLLAGERVYSRLEQLEAGSGLTVVLAAAMGELDGSASTLTWEPFESYSDDDAYQLLGEPIADYHHENDPRFCGVFVRAFACGPAGRRLFGVPVLA